MASVQETYLKEIADAIRKKTGDIEKIIATDFATKIMQLPSMILYHRTEIEYNDEKASEIVAVAQSYLDAIASGKLIIVYKAGYSALSGEHQKIKNESGQYIIQCSAFVGLVLRGISYEDSPYFEGDGSKINARTDLYTWANSDYEKAGISDANQLAEYALQTGCILNTNNTSAIKKGDILFYSKGNGEYFGAVWHVALAMTDGGTTCIHALNTKTTAIWTFDANNLPSNIDFGKLLYVARPRYNVIFKAEEVVELKILEQPQDFTGVTGDTAIFKVVAQGEGLTYMWQYSSNGTNWYQSGFDGWNTDTQPVGVATYRNGQKYRCIVTDAYGNTVTSNVATLYCTS